MKCKARPDIEVGPVVPAGNPKVEEAILFLVKWMRGKLVYTGRTLNANKCARILHIWQAFVQDHSLFLAKTFGYKAEGKAGQRGKMFAMFRDDILPAALRYGHVRSDADAGLSTSEIQARHVKRVSCRSDGVPSARSVEGWELSA